MKETDISQITDYKAAYERELARAIQLSELVAVLEKQRRPASADDFTRLRGELVQAKIRGEYYEKAYNELLHRVDP
jgi:hypothetical protein